MAGPPPEPPSAPESSSSPSLGAQAVWLLVAKTVGFALTVALPLVLVRRMSQAEFGLYKQVFLVVGTTVTILPLGFGMSAFYFLPRELQRRGSIVANIVVFHAMVGLIVASVIALRPDILAWILNNPELTLHARPVALVVLFWTIGSFLEIVAVALQDVRASTVFIVTSQFSKTALLLIAAVAFGTVDALIIAAIVQGLLQMAMLLAYLHVRFPGFWRAADARLLWQQATYALPVGGSSLLLKLQEDMHHVVVSNTFGAAAYAVYSVGVFKLPLIGILRESVGSVVLPRINQLEAQDAARDILRLVVSTARKLALVYYPLYAFLIVTGREVISLLFTPQYVSSWPIFAVALTVVPFSIIVLDPVTRALQERYFFLRLRITVFTVLMVILWTQAEQLGLLGIITAVVAANLFGWSVAVWRMARLLQVRRADLRLFRSVLKVAAAAAAAGVAAEVVRHLLAGQAPWLVLLAAAPVFAVTYIAGIVAARVIGPEEITVLFREVVRGVTRRPRGTAKDVRAEGSRQVPPAAVHGR
ncbi:MAG: oligosaccharide flippase family protein [Vicinamibacterales bacterium]